MSTKTTNYVLKALALTMKLFSETKPHTCTHIPWRNADVDAFVFNKFTALVGG